MASKEADKSIEETQDTEDNQQSDGPELSFGDVKYLLALTLVKNEVKNETKIKFDDAKKIIELIIHAGKGATPDPPQPGANQDDPEGVIKEDEYKRLENLGLGRGVDVTKPFPWQNKSSFQVRKINKKCGNIIGTEESGQREYYEEEVDSVLTQQFNTNLSIKEPSNGLVICIGAEHSRSFAETRKAVGHKVMTRTASFRSDIRDDMMDNFEEKLSEWILDRLETKRKWSLEDKDLITIPDKKLGTSKERLEKYLEEVVKKLAEKFPPEIRQSSDIAYRETWEVLQDCYDYVEQLGITHYVHTIKLGAEEYEVLTQETYDSQFTATPSFEVNKVAKAVVSANAGTGRHRRRTRKTVNSIGKIDDKNLTVKREAPDEAVLEIELKPLHSLIRMRALHLALKWALKRYIRRRESRKEGPFLIACGPDKKDKKDKEDKEDKEEVTVYWHVPKNSHEVRGTSKKEDASLFYIIKTDSSRHPHDFYIGYVGNDLSALELPKGPANPISKSKELAPIPHYVTADLGMMGSSNKLLRVTAGTHKNRARFTLHSSTVRKYAFTRTPVDTDKWAEGGGYFINCSRRMFKLDGYVAMERHDPPTGGQNTEEEEGAGAGGGDGMELQERRPGQQQQQKGSGAATGQQQEGGGGGGGEDEPSKKDDIHTYTTSCKTSVKSHSNNWPWMVFRLLPGEHKDTSLEEHKLEPKELGEPLIDRSKFPITYQSDERDFQLLFGDPTARAKTNSATDSLS